MMFYLRKKGKNEKNQQLYCIVNYKTGKCLITYFNKELLLDLLWILNNDSNNGMEILLETKRKIRKRYHQKKGKLIKYNSVTVPKFEKSDNWIEKIMPVLRLDGKRLNN